MFSTDFPHPEGTRDPVGRFELHPARLKDQTSKKFYVENMRVILGSRGSARPRDPLRPR
jgi:hypothetical protein